VKAKVLVRVAGTSILKNKLRSMLTMLGVIIGVGSVILMVAVGDGARSRIQDQVQRLGTNMIVITPGSSNQGGVSQGAQSFNRLTLDDAEKLKRESTLLTAVSPVVVAPSQAVGGAGNWRTVINGVAVDFLAIRDWGAKSGRFFDDEDVRANRKVAVLGGTVADGLFPDQDPVGQEIRLRNQPFEIIGVLARKGQTANGSDQDDVVLAPYTTVHIRLAGRSFIAQILASAASRAEMASAEADARAIMRESHELTEGEADDFTIRDQTDLAETATATTEVMTLLLAAIASISLLVGGIGIMNIMLVSVTERTREIGIRQAIGARGSDVLTQFLVESTVMSVFGGLLGLAVGAGAAKLVSHFTGWSTVVSPAAVIQALGFSAAVGIFFGFYPARQAASMNPIEALRYE
jgi:putative ABC transport system permease protein